MILTKIMKLDPRWKSFLYRCKWLKQLVTT